MKVSFLERSQRNLRALWMSSSVRSILLPEPGKGYSAREAADDERDRRAVADGRVNDDAVF